MVKPSTATTPYEEAREAVRIASDAVFACLADVTVQWRYGDPGLALNAAEDLAQYADDLLAAVQWACATLGLPTRGPGVSGPD